MKKENLNPVFFKNQDEFRVWLEENHAKEKELWVGFYKKSTGKPSMTWPESVDQALCFGWIDGIRYKYDEEGYCIRFTPRKKKSTWSAINIAKVKKLEHLGWMRPAGLEVFSNCRETEGAHYSFEAPVKELPEEYTNTFKASSDAWEYFVKQPPSYKKMVVHWILVAKQKETRIKRLEELIRACGLNKRLFDRTL